jgi:Transposase IS116/IS110/IS902 family
LARQDKGCERLMTVPGIGPIISSAMVAAIGTGDVFSKGRDFGAWLGLVPKQISTDDRTILGKISRRGNRYLRVLFVQAAWVVLVKVKCSLIRSVRSCWSGASPCGKACVRCGPSCRVSSRRAPMSSRHGGCRAWRPVRLTRPTELLATILSSSRPLLLFGLHLHRSRSSLEVEEIWACPPDHPVCRPDLGRPLSHFPLATCVSF